ncbi:hypothetical protein BTN99_13015 [Vibrio campbellii]|nr:hypothetical protein BTN99_13015 [Vibrio campbellii]
MGNKVYKPRPLLFAKSALRERVIDSISASNNLVRAGYYAALFSLLTFGKQGINDNALNPVS